ncbi:N-acetylneuraminate synthase family protein, partial [Paracoccaceae bacterium]|nr:N-acetylneuraminate synthase family protein [Paracoccaceae bacterium]
MIISKNIKGYVFNKDLSIKAALTHLESTGLQILFIVDYRGRLYGVVTDGDIRRWLLQQKEVDLYKKISVVAPKRYVSALKGSRLSDLRSVLSTDKKQIPLVDNKGVLVGVVSEKKSGVVIGHKQIGTNYPTYIIAEIGNNHQGNLDCAKQLIEKAAAAGVDSVKFQMRSMSKLFGVDAQKKNDSWDLGAQYTSDLLSKYQLSDDDLFAAFDHCKAFNVEPICTPWDLDSLEKLEKYGLLAYKVASADFTNHELLEAIAKKHSPMICSTGMCTEEEIVNSVELLKDHGAQCILLHCNSTYPTPFKDINLRYLSKLKRHGFDIGYSGHERGGFIPLAAVTLGACVVEKHITLDRSQEGNDHKVSLLPDELRQMVQQIRDLETSMGYEHHRVISQGELINREVLAKSLFAKHSISQGDKITRDMVGVKSPGQGLQPNKIEALIGRVSNRVISQGTFFYQSDIETAVIRKDKYDFNRPYGIPVRYHDFENLTCEVKVDFVEFHLSYQDLKLKPIDYIGKQKLLSFSVHVPELFAGDHILDLCSLDDEYRKTSISHLNKVIDHCNYISECFPNNSASPILVLNAGGWTKNGFIKTENKEDRYEILKDSISRVKTSDVQLAIQTMPPFPWHFGGQSFHNLFVNPEEIRKFCEETSQKICLDVSHSMMACNYYGWSLSSFIDEIGKHIIYLHVVDAQGSDGEGI